MVMHNFKLVNLLYSGNKMKGSNYYCLGSVCIHEHLRPVFDLHSPYVSAAGSVQDGHPDILCVLLCGTVRLR